MDSKEFLTSYLNDFSDLVKPGEDVVDQLIEITQLLKAVHSDGKKTLIFGNGGSAAIASHFSVDLTKLAAEGKLEIKLLRVFDPNDGKGFPPRTAYDRHDHWFVPFPDPMLVKRPGPRIEVYLVSRPE